MKRFCVLLMLVSIVLSLTSCISYVSGDFEPERGNLAGNTGISKKAYIEEVIFDVNSSVIIGLNKQKEAGFYKDFNTMQERLDETNKYVPNQDDYDKIKNYVCSTYPNLFSATPEGAIPIRLTVNSERSKISFSHLGTMVSAITMFIIPSNMSTTQNFTLQVETIGEEYVHTRYSQYCQLNYSEKKGLLFSPFVFLALGSAREKSMGMINAGLGYQNYYLSDSFAYNVAAPVAKLLQSVKRNEGTGKKTSPKRVESKTINDSAKVSGLSDNKQDVDLLISYPRPYIVDADNLYTGFSRRRPAETVTQEEKNLKAVSISPNHFKLSGTWTSKQNTVSLHSDGNYLNTSSTSTRTFSEDGTCASKHVIDSEGNVLSKSQQMTVEYKGTWKTDSNYVSWSMDLVGSSIEYSMNQKWVIRWLNEDTFELIVPNLEVAILEGQKNTRKGSKDIKSGDHEMWYDESGNIYSKIKIMINGKTTETLSITARSLYHRVK